MDPHRFQELQVTPPPIRRQHVHQGGPIQRQPTYVPKTFLTSPTPNGMIGFNGMNPEDIKVNEQLKMKSAGEKAQMTETHIE